MPASGKSFPRNSPDSRTTEKHVFQGPGEGETLSQERAARYQNASMTSTLGSSSGGSSTMKASIKKQIAQTMKKEPKVVLPQRERPPPVAAPMARDGLNLKKVKPPPELADDWFSSDPLNPEPGRHGPYDIEGVRSGMSHPPQNPKVRKQLLAYLHAREVPHTKERRPIRSPRRIRSRSQLDSTLSHDTSWDDDGEYRGEGLAASGFLQTSPPGLSRSASMPLPANEGRTRKKEAPAVRSNNFTLQEERKPRLPPGEDEVQRSREDLRRTSRFHGFELDKRGAPDLAELAIYHNEVTRRHYPNAMKQVSVTPGQKLRELQHFLLDAGEAGEDDDERSRGAKRDMASPFGEGKLIRPLYYEDFGPLAAGGQASPGRIRRVVDEIKHGKRPNQLQLMARATGMSVITGEKLMDEF
mmetsp:Transcript_66770/g.118152  ORF Transcript_66770/g.118152 Transcript_66770/m.118152 type:complete len:413 (+) Transcript_66770:90-1328(+)